MPNHCILPTWTTSSISLIYFQSSSSWFITQLSAVLQHLMPCQSHSSHTSSHIISYIFAHAPSHHFIHLLYRLAQPMRTCSSRSSSSGAGHSDSFFKQGEMSQQRLVVLDIFSSNIAAAFSSSRGHSPLQVFYFLLLHHTRQPSLLG